MWSDQPTFDAIVVGSGYGGSIAACRLAQAGLQVCVLEKGKRWEPHEFPTTPWQLLCNMRFHTPLGSFGSKDALYEVHSQGDSVALVGSGLGGGSLVNAGIIMATPQRARRDPKWPKEWEEDWDVYEARSHAVLEPEEIPYEPPKSKIMDKIQNQIEGATKDSVKLTMSFAKKKNVAGVAQNACIACGNCLSGCSYNAKSSTDRNYLELAMQSGAEICTRTEVMFIRENLGDCFDCLSCTQKSICLESQRRRWRVYLNEVDYISADYVILAAGVLGTNGILLRSRERGLQVSQRLGHGLSCNGNNIALVSATNAQTQAHGLEEKHFSKTPLQFRPGPVISSSHTSSLGFTIQGSSIPRAAPDFLLKGVVTYGGFIAGIWEHIKQWIGNQSSQAIVLNMMGYDAADGQITLNHDTGRVTYQAPKDVLLPTKVRTAQKLAKRLCGKLYMSRFRSTAVHLLGGCNAAADSTTGVANANGQVFSPGKNEIQPGNESGMHEGLYVCDASLIPCSVGVNPINTITIVAERVASRIVTEAVENFQQRGIKVSLPMKNRTGTYLISKSQSSQVTIKETLRGELSGLPCTLQVVLRMGRRQSVAKTQRRFGDSHSLLQGYVGGKLLLPSIEPAPLHIIEGSVDMCWVDERTPFTQFMHYHLLLSTNTGTLYVLDGRKTMRPFLSGLWCYGESTTLDVVLRQLPSDRNSKTPLIVEGKLQVSISELIRSIVTLKGPRRLEFVRRLAETLARTYLTRVPRNPSQKRAAVDLPQDNHADYPNYALHKLVTGDGVTITCKQWSSTASDHEDGKSRVVLLLNGYSTESFCLPTERHDIVRTLIKNGYEPWLLEARSHPSHPANSFDFDDIARYDIPAALDKIRQVKKEPVAAHVIAHCVGGLSIHMSLMGGFISPSSVASLICTNSSMFFCLVPSALVKLNLPLIPISMKILGKNQVIPISTAKDQKIWWRHRLLRSIARAIPRTESCECDECNVFSGIFGSPFWHENVRQETHDWLNKQATPVLPMSAFPHLRSIARSQHIVDARGKETYMSHPERLAVHSMYISGGQPILVTPETSIRAAEFMRRHQPAFSHERIVIPKYGHSDLWIGEDSHRDVFPRVLERLKRVQESSKSDAELNLLENKILPWETSLIAYKNNSSAFVHCLTIVMLLFCILLVFITVI